MEGQIQVQKINESFYQIKGSNEQLQPIIRRLQVKIPGANFDPMVKRGLKPSYKSFYNIMPDKSLVVPSGLMRFLEPFGVYLPQHISRFTREEIQAYIDTTNLPFEPFQHQLNSVFDSILNHQQINLMCTGSGKSLSISLIADFFRLKGLKGLLIVPNINLLTQFQSDIKDYNLIDLYNDTHIIGGGNTDKHFDKSLTISTFQSLKNFKDELKHLNYVMCDETHRAKGAEIQDIVNKCSNSIFRLGFTGTLNDSPPDRMSLFCLFGVPKRYISTNGLVKLGLATPVNINVLLLHYSPDDKAIFRHVGNFAKQLQFIKEHENRTNFISKLSCKLSTTSGNTLVLFQHTEHGKSIFNTIMNDIYPDVLVENKNITGKKSFEFQEKYKVYFINGETDGKNREKIRNILETDTNSILVAGYQVLSTGVNIKNLRNLVFASPMKSFTTISQSLGRGVRLHVSKSVFNVYDLSDCFTPKGTFMKQLEQRKILSYEPEEFPILERTIHI
jgi:superfamily II DNA or RNA helicase